MTFAAAVIIGFALGAIPVAVLWGRSRGVDLTRAGSGNPGAANAYRVLGARAGLGVLAADVTKGALAVFSAGLLGGGAATEIAAGAASVAGHVAGPFTRGRGGKGIATGCGMFLVLAPSATLVSVTVWTFVFAVSRFVSLASIVTAIFLPFVVLLTRRGEAPGAVFWASSAVAALVLFRHRGNIARLLGGREPRFSLHPEAGAASPEGKRGVPHE